jgi:hypothetical protein
MTKPFTTLTVIVLTVFTLAHLYRLIAGMEVVVSGHTVPQWISGLAAVVAGTLALMVWRESRGR